jgi:hypothetical protein
MRLNTAIGLCLVLLIAAVPAHAYEGGGGLDLTPRACARAAAMGETGLVAPAGSGDCSANPALLAWNETRRIDLGYASLVQGLTASATHLCGVVPFGGPVEVAPGEKAGSLFGAGLCLEHGGLDLSQGTGWSWNLISLGLGCRLTSYASAGVAVKYLSGGSDLQGADVRAYAADAGVAAQVSRLLSVGLAVRNGLGRVDWKDGEAESPPALVAVGMGMALPYRIAAEVAAVLSGSRPAKLGAGFEGPMGRSGLAIRVGYVHFSGDYSRNVFTTGLGYRYRMFDLDYAVKLDDDLALGTTHTFSLGYKLP